MRAQLHLQSNGQPNPALFNIIHRIYHSPTHLNNLLNAATEAKSLKHATQIHSQLIINRYISFPFLFNNLLNLYAKCGRISQALTLFSFIHGEFKNVVTWTSLITQLSHCNKHAEALNYFNKMRGVSVYPNQHTFSAVLPACSNTKVLANGGQMHCLIKKHGFDSDVFVGSALIDMYAKCSDMGSAEKVFDEIPERNFVSWNSMIVGFLQNGLYDRASGMFMEGLREGGVIPDEVNCSSVLSVCANMIELEFGMQVHGVVVKHGLISLTFVGNSLMDMYGKCGALEDARNLFTRIKDRDVVAWNVMMMACVQNCEFEEACNYFRIMRCEGVSSDEASLSTALHATAYISAFNQGAMIHDYVIKAGFLRYNSVSSLLITMYAKCGSLVDSFRVFEQIRDQSVVSWTAMIAACKLHGRANEVIELFHDMLREGMKPNYITFVCVLSACSHTGRVKEGFYYFNSMENLHGVSPGQEHYACMVDLLARAGRLDEAKEFLKSQSLEPYPSVYGALLGACRNHGNLEMAREVAETLVEIEPDNPGNYVLLCNMYVDNGMLEEASEMRRLMGIKRVRKEHGCSWIDVKGTTFVFTVHDRSHSRTDEIYNMLAKLEELVKKKGYVEEYREGSLWHHSEWMRG